MEPNARLIEDATDEIARLDQVCLVEVPAISRACWLATIAATETANDSFEPLVAAEADAVHEQALRASIVRTRDFAATEERRLRGGSPLSLARWEPLTPGLATYPHRHQVEAAWSAGTRVRSVLELAIGTAAWLDDPALGAEPTDLAGIAFALLLCASGRTARLRFQPLAAIDPVLRAAASQAWREGTDDRWAPLVLEGIIRKVRRTRDALLGLDRARERDESALGSLGRAAINARRALAHLQSALASTMPLTARSLDLSRPAAAAALERLVELGIAREVTGRSRDRVFAWDAPLAALAGAQGTASAV